MPRLFAPLFAVGLVAGAPALAAETVAPPHFNGIQLSGGGDVVVVPGRAERVTILQGSTQFTRMRVDSGGKLVIENCEHRCPAHYRLKVEVQSPLVPALAVTGRGVISVAKGFSRQRQLFVAADGGGSVDARAVESADVFAATNGGGLLQVRASVNLFGSTNGGGLVRYWGNPQVMTSNEGGGAVQAGH